MNKQRLLTIAGIALSFIVAVGGWALTDALIDRKSDALLSASGTTWVGAADVRPSPTHSNTVSDDLPDEVPKLTEQEEQQIVSVLHNWEAKGKEKPHEPMAGQIQMEQAVEIGNASLLFFCEQGLIPNEAFVLKNAYLCQNILPGQDEPFLDPVFSYWVLRFSSESTGATVTVNALTGQAWKAEIKMNIGYTAVFTSNDAENLLIAFLSAIGIMSGKEMNVIDDSAAGLTAYLDFADGNACAVAGISTIVEAEDLASIFGIQVYLSTQTP